MSATFVHEGKYIDYTPGSAVTAGDIIDLGLGMVGIATSDIAANAVGALAIEGVFDITKANTTDTGSFGDPVTVTPATDDCDVTTAGPHTLVVAATSGPATARIKINTGMPEA